MYRDVAKRVLAVILTFCMIGSMPDFTLLAGVANENVRTDTSLEGLAEEDGSSETLELAGTETEASLGTEEEAAGTNGTEQTEEAAEPDAAEQPADADETDTESGSDAAEGDAEEPGTEEKISLQDTRIKKPSELPNQIRGGIVPDADGFVKDAVLGLEIKDGDVLLTQITDKASSADGYKVTAVMGDSNASAELTVTGSGKYNGNLKYSVLFGNDLTGSTVTLSYGEYPAGTTSYSYEGREIAPSVEVKMPDQTVLVSGTDYSVQYADNRNAGTARVTIRGTGRYAGERTENFIIMQTPVRNLFEVKVSGAVFNQGKAKTADGITPSEVTITNKLTGEPAASEDYGLSYENNKSISTALQKAQLIVTGTGNCSGSERYDYEITKANFNDAAYAEEDKIIVELDPSYSLSYTGQPLRPPFTAYQGSKENGALIGGTDYDAEYSNNVNIGTAEIKITGKGNYAGERIVNFTIGKFNVRDIDASKIHVEEGGYAYTGEEIRPEVPNSLTDTAGHPLTEGKDYEVRYANNINAGNGIIRVVGMGNCTGELDVYFTIYKDMGHEDIVIEPIADQQYSGKAVHPLPVVQDKGTRLQKDRHYTVSYDPADPVDVDTYKITVTGDGKHYRGTKEAEFKIVSRSMDSVEVQFTRPVENNTYTFTGSAIQPEVKVVDKQDGTELPIADFDIAYTDAGGETSPTAAGNCTVTVTPKDVNKYSGTSASVSYTIAPKPLKEGRNFTVKLDGQDSISPSYTGEDIEPVVAVLDNLRDSTTGAQVPSGGAFQIPASDFSVQYTNNRDAGTATVTVTGQNNYSGSISKNFRITPLDLSNAQSVGITLQPDREYVYTGEPVAPAVAEVTVDGRVLRADEFTVTSRAVNAGDTDQVFTVTGTGNYRGSIASDAPIVEGGPVTFRILPKDITDLEVQMEDIPNQSYTGRELRPVPVLTYNGKALGAADYDLTYANNVELDHNTDDPALMPTVTVTGKGNFTGTRSANFHICETLAGAVVTGLDNLVYTFNTAEWRPEPQSVVLNGRTLQKDVDYELFYKNNINAGNSSSPEAPTVIINGKGLYGGSIEKKFTIERVTMTLDRNGKLEPPLSSIVGMSPMFTGSAVWPTVTLKHSVRLETGASFTYVLEEGKDYEFSSNKHIDAGNIKYNIEIQPKGNYKLGTGTALRLGQYTIKAKPITAQEISIEVGEVDATRLPAEPPVRIIDARRDVDGNYTEENGTFELVRNRDYTLSYKKNTAPGTASITITGKGNYTGSATETFLIPGNLSNAQVEFLDSSDSSDAYVYTGSDITPKIRVTCGTDATTGRVIELKSGTDFEYQINGDHTNCGTPEIELIGKGAYEGSSRRLTFRITPRSLTDTAVKINVPGSVDYDDGKNVEPKPSITLGKYTLIEGTDFICIYDDPCSMPSHISGKKYKVVIRAVSGGNFTGETFKEYTIGNNFKVKIEFADGSNGSYTYTGSEIIPVLKVTDEANGKELVKGKDYDMSYAPGNINVGKVTVTVFGLGEPGNTETEYCGSKTTSFDIVGKSLGDPDIVMEDIADYTYTSAAIMPEPKVVWKGHGADGADVELVAGEDFKYTYTSNTNAGTGTVRIEAASQKSNFSGTQEKTFTILKKNLEDEGVTIDGIPDQVYIGDAIAPKLNIHWEADGVGRVTLSDADYTLSYGEEGNVEVGTVEVTVNGTGNYEGTITTAFRIVKVKLSDITAEYSKEEQYTGKQIKPEVKLTYQSTDNRTIEMNAPDVWGYAITYGNNQLLGTTSGSITVTADPNGNCEGGPLVLHFAIIKRHLDDSTITMTGIEDTYTFDPNESACEPEPVLTFKPDPLTTYTLRKGYDYTVAYEGNTTVNQAASVTVTGIGNFDRSLTKTFRITKDLLDYIDSASVDRTPLVYNGAVQHPKVNINFKTNDIEENRDYELVWDEDCINAGEHTVVIRGIGDYGGEMSLTFTIGKRDISHVQIDIEDYEFTGSEIDPMVVVSDPEISETPFGGDVYVITGIENNKEIGTATVTIEAVETSNYTGTTSGTFEITPVDLQSARMTSSQIDSPQDYTGNPITPGFTVTDTRRNARGDAISEEDGESFYVLVEGTDYSVEYTDNIYPGETPATVTVTGTGSYTGTLVKVFDIQADLSLAEIAPIPAQAYTGEEVRPELSVTLGDRTLRENFDYRVEYTDNIERGTALATIYPMEGSHYTGSNQASFVISRDIAGADIEISHSEYVFTGGAICPEVTVVFEGKNLVLGTDFNVTYENNVNVGTATIVISGIGGYDGSVTLTFEIVSRDITDARIELIDSEFTYTGGDITPAAAVVLGDIVLKQGVDYEIRYENNRNVGTASIIVTGIGGNEGTVRRTYEIIKRNITRCTFANITDKIFTGTPTAQDLIVTDTAPTRAADDGTTTLVLNRDYTLTYENNAAPGVATLVVSGIGNYGGTKTIRYLIRFTEMTAVSAAASTDSVTLSWGAVPGAEGYGIYTPDGRLIARTEGVSYVHANLDALTTYDYMVRPYKTSGGTAYYGNFSNTAQATTGILTPAITLKAGKKRVKVSWKKIKGVNGYEIYRSNKKTKGYKKIKTASKASIVAYTNKKLTSKKKYYYKVRAYKNVNGKKVYSSYSSVKSVKAK